MTGTLTHADLWGPQVWEAPNLIDDGQASLMFMTYEDGSFVEREKIQMEANAASVGASKEWVALLLEQRILGVSQADGLAEAGW